MITERTYNGRTFTVGMRVIAIEPLLATLSNWTWTKGSYPTRVITKFPKTAGQAWIKMDRTSNNNPDGSLHHLWRWQPDGQPLSEQQFITAVFDRLPAMQVPSTDQQSTWEQVQRLYHEKWSIEDVVAYCNCMEEVNPNLAEDVALARMALIAAKYPKP